MARPMTATELRNEPTIEYDKTTIGRPFEPKNPEWHTHERVNTYMVDSLRNYEINRMYDESLWEMFQEDFEDWNESLFALGHRTVRTAVRDYIRNNGIYTGSARYISQQLADVLKEDKYTAWPEEEVAKHLKSGRTLNSCQNPAVRAKIEADISNAIGPTVIQPTATLNPTATPNLTAAIYGATLKPPIFTPMPSPSPSPAPGLTAKTLTDLSKLYSNEAKFGGEMYDILDAKLKIFREMCRMADIQPSHYHEAFPIMLKGRAHQFYYDHLAEHNFGFEDMIKRTKDFFHTAENHQLYLQEWRATTLQNVIAQNPDKSLPQNLEILIDKLQKIQRGLSTNYQGDYNLRDQLVSACQGVSACRMVLLKPSATFESVASDLRNAIGIEMRCQNPATRQYYTSNGSEHDEDINEQFWVDRKYEGRAGYRSRSSNRGGYKGGGRGGGRDGGRDKRCFVCGRTGCWSTKHTAEERRQRQDKWRRFAREKGQGSSVLDFAAFLTDYEGVDTSEWDSNSNNYDHRTEFEVWCTMDNRDDHTVQYTQYLTDYGPVDGNNTVAILNEQAALHGFTKADIFNQEPLEPANQFYFKDHYSSETFQGIMPDTGAAGVSTAGEEQYKALQKKNPTVRLDTSTAGRHHIRFGDNPDIRSLGTVGVNTLFGTVHFEVVPANTPFLFCLNDMDKHNVYFNNVRDVLVHGDKEYPVVRKWGHPWLLIDEPERSIAWCHLTETELRQLHRRFGHPAAERLHRLLTRAGYDEIDKATIAKITKFCHQCQMHSNAPGRFKFTLRDDMEFNYQVLADIMFIDEKPVLHILDMATSFQAARFLRNMTAKEVWDTLRLAWIDTYVGPPDTIITDAGTNFISQEFKANAHIMAIELEEVPVEAHNSIGKLERYHAPLQRAYNVIAADLRGQGMNTEAILQMAIKAVNDTAGPDGLVPTLLVFGTYPRLVDSSPPSPSIAARSIAVRKAMAEVRKEKAKQQIAEALGMRNGPNTVETLGLPLQAEVKVWRENIGWKGLYILLGRDGETCTVDINGKATNFRTVVVKPYHRDESTETPIDTNTGEEDAPENEAEAEADDNWTPAEHRPHELQPTKRRRGRPRGSKNKPKTIDTNMTAAYLSAKERTDYDLALRLRKEGKITTEGAPFELSDKKEVDALIGQGVFAFEMFDPAQHGDTHIFRSRLVREIKGKGTDTPYEKSRLVIQGHSDDGKELVLTQAPTIQRMSQRIIVVIAPSLKEMDLWLRDITQAYVQSATTLQRTILAYLPTQIEYLYPKGTIMAVIKPLYGIAEAGTHWWATYFNHHREKLGMVTSTYDPCLLITESPDRFGIVGMQTDDTLILCDSDFGQLEEDELNKAKFVAKPKERLTTDNSLAFNGCILTKAADGRICLCQKKQGERLKPVSKDPAASKQQYTEQRARGAYIASICQPEAAFDLSTAAQHKDPGNDDIEHLNKRLEWQIANIDRGLTYVPLDLRAAKLFVFVDGSFANNKDLTSQIGYEIFLANETTTADMFTMTGNLIYWSSTKCKRVTRSILASEIYAMTNGVDMGVAMATTLNMIMAKLGTPKTPLIVCTDSLSLYECLVKLGTTKEKRLMVDIMSLRQSYERRELFEIRWIHGQDNPADAMTKSRPNDALQRFVDTNRLTLRVQGWVKRG